MHQFQNVSIQSEGNTVEQVVAIDPDVDTLCSVSAKSI